jgi:Zn-dependent protease
VSSIYFFIALIPSIVLHEVSHGYVAFLFGDPTAKEDGRLTLNPIRHIDPFGTILLPALLVFAGAPAFGWAKPVPVNTARLRHPRNQSVLVLLAGPAVNIGLSVLSLLVVRFLLGSNGSVLFLNIFVAFGIVNVTLAVFNLIPLPPFDGSALVERLWPQNKMVLYYRLRAAAMPFAFALVLLDSYTTRLFPSIESHVVRWWFSLLW